MKTRCVKYIVTIAMSVNISTPAKHELFARLDKISELWCEAESQLRAIHIPHAITLSPFELSGNRKASLGLRKQHGQWRICVSEFSEGGDQGAWRPHEEWSGEIRIAAANHYPALRKYVEDAVRNSVVLADYAINTLTKGINAG
jgi:hypothetical protein